MKLKISLFLLLLALLVVGAFGAAAATNHNPLVLLQTPYYMTAGGGTAVRLMHSGGQIAFASQPDQWRILPIPHLSRMGLGVNGNWVANYSYLNGEICQYNLDGQVNITSTHCIPQGKLNPDWIPIQLIPSTDGQKLVIQHTIDRTTTCPDTNLLAYTISVYDFTASTVTTLTPMAYGAQISPSNGWLGYIEVRNNCQFKRFVMQDLNSSQTSIIETASGFAFTSDGIVVVTDATVDFTVHPVMFADQLVFTREAGSTIPETISLGGNERQLDLEMGVHELTVWNDQLFISYFDTVDHKFKLTQYAP